MKKFLSVFFLLQMMILGIGAKILAVEPTNVLIRYAKPGKNGSSGFDRHRYSDRAVNAKSLIAKSFNISEVRVIAPEKIESATLDVFVQMPESYDPPDVRGFSGWKQMGEALLHYFNCQAALERREVDLLLLTWSDDQPPEMIKNRNISASIYSNETLNEGQGKLEDLARTIERQNRIPVLINKPLSGFLTWSLPFDRNNPQKQFEALARQQRILLQPARKLIDYLVISEK